MTTTISFESMSEQQILDIANPIMDNLMDASTHIDHARHVRDFTDRMKAIVTTEYLQRVCQQYQSEKGYFSSRVPVAVFKRPDSAAIVWKQSWRLFYRLQDHTRFLQGRFPPRPSENPQCFGNLSFIVFYYFVCIGIKFMLSWKNCVNAYAMQLKNPLMD